MRKTNAICIVLCVCLCVDWYRDFLAQSLYLQLNSFVKAVATVEQQGSKSGDFIIDRLVLKRLCKTLWIVHKNTHTHTITTMDIPVARARNRNDNSNSIRASMQACGHCWLTSMAQMLALASNCEHKPCVLIIYLDFAETKHEFYMQQIEIWKLSVDWNYSVCVWESQPEPMYLIIAI